jgi:hypothetical protein
MKNGYGKNFKKHSPESKKKISKSRLAREANRARKVLWLLKHLPKLQNS